MEFSIFLISMGVTLEVTVPEDGPGVLSRFAADPRTDGAGLAAL